MFIRRLYWSNDWISHTYCFVKTIKICFVTGLVYIDTTENTQVRTQRYYIEFSMLLKSL